MTTVKSSVKQSATASTPAPSTPAAETKASSVSDKLGKKAARDDWMTRINRDRDADKAAVQTEPKS
jgi:hypothetical protein